MRCYTRCEKALRRTERAFWTLRMWERLCSDLLIFGLWVQLSPVDRGRETQAPWILGSKECYPFIQLMCYCLATSLGGKINLVLVISLLSVCWVWDCVFYLHHLMEVTHSALVPATQHLRFTLYNLAMILRSNLFLSSCFRFSRNNPSSEAVYPFYTSIFVLRLFSWTNDF